MASNTNLEQIEIDGERYTLDTKKALKQGTLKKLPKRPPICTGQHYVDMADSNNAYVLTHLAGPDDEAVLVSMKDGLTYTNPKIVVDPRNITRDEWNLITDGDAEDFTLIHNIYVGYDIF